MFFSQAEWDMINRVADKRRVNNVTPWHINNPYLEVIGAAGELVARNFYGLPEELHEHFDGGIDFKYGRFTFDVKATLLTPQAEYRYLQWPEKKIIKADIILLTAIHMEKRMGIILGFAYASEMQAAPINRNRTYPCHEIPVAQLHSERSILINQLRSEAGLAIEMPAAML